MAKVQAHITFDGKPLCWQRPDLMGLDIRCGHATLTAAHDSRRELQRRFYWRRIAVIRGRCPAYDGGRHR